MARQIKVTPEVDAWRARCPLRLWLAKQQRPGTVARIMAATGLGTRQAVYAWMLGYSKPTHDALRALQALTKIRPQQWYDWWDQQPEDTPCPAGETANPAG